VQVVLEIAERLGDLRLRILTTTHLEITHHSRGDYGRVVELATDNLRVLPEDWVYEFGVSPPSVQDRYWLVSSLSQLGRFAEAATQGAEALRLAELAQHAFTIGAACLTAAMPRQGQGDWAAARSLYERLDVVLRGENVVQILPLGVAAYALTLAHLGEVTAALDQLREGERLLERRELDVLEPLPRAATMDLLRLEQPDHGLCEGVVVRVPGAADRRLDARLGQPLRAGRRRDSAPDDRLIGSRDPEQARAAATPTHSANGDTALVPPFFHSLLDTSQRA
jgi:hypothetical protein